MMTGRITTTTTTAGEAKSFPLPDPEAERIAQRLADTTTCPLGRARAAAARALAEGYDPVWVELQILYWNAYAQSPRGRSIDNPGAFVAARVAAGQAAPRWVVLDNVDDRLAAAGLRQRWESEQEEADEDGSSGDAPD